MKLLRFIFWPLIMLKNILDPNWWSEKIIDKTKVAFTTLKLPIH